MTKLERGINDLQTTNPEVAEEWNYDKNGDLQPSDVLPGSHKKVWWKCQEGHEWEAIIRDRVEGKPCPYCSNYKVLSGFNDLAAVNPEVAAEWNSEKNGTLTPDQVKYSANIKVWWKCPNGHEWEAYVFNRSKGHGCPYCSNFSAMAGYNDLATTNPELIKEWDYENNGDLMPSDVLAGSHKKVWWKCSKGHSWKAEVKSRSEGQNCPYCSNKRVLVGYNDLYTYCINNNREDLINEFDEAKNGFSMKDVTIGSAKILWWKCPKGHSYQAAAHRRIRTGSGCGICSHNILMKNENDLLTTNPEIAQEWDYDKNDCNPDEVMAGSNIKKYWFICPKGHSYQATPLSRKKGSNCPICSMETHTSFPEKAIFFYIKQYFDKAMENYRSAFLGRKELDIFIPDLKVAIEYDGVAWHKDVDRDVKKDIVCQKHGIILIRIRENGCADYHSDSIKHYIPPYDMQQLKDSILFIFDFINQKFQLNMKADIDVDRDRIDILNKMNLSEKENSIASCCPEIIQYWDYEKNGRITPEQISHASVKKAFFKCESGHEWEAIVSNFASHPWCPYCSGRRVLSGFNDLFTTNPELIPLWSKSNIIDPTKIKSGSNKKALWYCPDCGGEYEMKIVKKVKTPGCPYCSGHRVLKGYNDLSTFFPEIALDWDFEKNTSLMPDEVTKGSSKKAWWKCHVCGYEWKTSICSRTGKNKTGCPHCSKSRINAKCVVQMSLDGTIIAEYPSAAEAERQTGIKSIHKVCRGEEKTAGGFIWKYKTDNDDKEKE